MTRAEKAKELFMEGYACSQAVALAFVDLTDVSYTQMKKLSLPLGGGLSRLRQTCGAVNSIAIIIGLLFSKDENTQENKTDTYAIVQELVKKFEKEKGTLSCGQLLINAGVEVEIGGSPASRTESYYHHRPCEEIVYLAAKILEDYLIEKEIIK